MSPERTRNAAGSGPASASRPDPGRSATGGTSHRWASAGCTLRTRARGLGDEDRRAGVSPCVGGPAFRVRLCQNRVGPPHPAPLEYRFGGLGQELDEVLVQQLVAPGFDPARFRAGSSSGTRCTRNRSAKAWNTASATWGGV